MNIIKSYSKLKKIWENLDKFIKKNIPKSCNKGFYIKHLTYDDIDIEDIGPFVLDTFPLGTLVKVWKTNFCTNLDSIQHTGDMHVIQDDQDFQYYHYIIAAYVPRSVNLIVGPKQIKGDRFRYEYVRGVYTH